jgi:hypothetical protein
LAIFGFEWLRAHAAGMQRHDVYELNGINAQNIVPTVPTATGIRAAKQINAL